MTKTSITTFQYPTSPFTDWKTYKEKISDFISYAVDKGSRLVLFSEYAGMDFVSTASENIEDQVEEIQSYLPSYTDLFQKLATENNIYIIPGTILIKDNEGKYRNRAFIFSPHNKHDYQDKLILTPAEKSINILQGGSDIKVFQLDFAKIGINVCYDSEFPYIAQQQSRLGAQLILVPTCTDSLLGLTRVTICCRARAIENQCYVAQSCLINPSSISTFIDTNVGQSGIYGPADLGFPETGILSQTTLNEPGAANAELDWDKLNVVREKGQVTNFKDHACKMDFAMTQINL